MFVLTSSCHADKINSGIRGKIIATDTAPLPDDMEGIRSGEPMPNVVVIIHRFYGNKKKEFGRVKTNSIGQFWLRCSPGQYSLMAKPREANNGYTNIEVKAKVQSDKFAYVETNFDCGH